MREKYFLSTELFTDELIDKKIPFIMNINNGNQGNHTHNFIVNFKRIFVKLASVNPFRGINYLHTKIYDSDINLSDYLMFKIRDKFIFIKTSSNQDLFLKRELVIHFYIDE